MRERVQTSRRRGSFWIASPRLRSEQGHTLERQPGKPRNEQEGQHRIAASDTPCQGRADDRTEAVGRAEDPHAASARFRCRDVRNIGLGCGEEASGQQRLRRSRCEEEAERQSAAHGSVQPTPDDEAKRQGSEHRTGDPVVAARLIARLGGPWSVTLIGGVGGFDAGSRLTWQALGTVNYRWNENWMLRAGYRALHVDYRSGRFLYDTTMHGPILAATYRF